MVGLSNRNGGLRIFPHFGVMQVGEISMTGVGSAESPRYADRVKRGSVRDRRVFFRSVTEQIDFSRFAMDSAHSQTQVFQATKRAVGRQTAVTGCNAPANEMHLMQYGIGGPRFCTWRLADLPGSASDRVGNPDLRSLSDPRSLAADRPDIENGKIMRRQTRRNRGLQPCR